MSKLVRTFEFVEVWKKVEKGIKWDKIHTTMRALDWVYASYKIQPSGIPSIDDLKKNVQGKLQYVMTQEIDKPCTFSTSGGGFKVTRFVREGKVDGYCVEFIVTYADVYCGLDEFCGTNTDETL